MTGLRAVSWGRVVAWLLVLFLVYFPILLVAFDACRSLEEVPRLLWSARVGGLFLRSATVAVGATFLATLLGTAGAVCLEGAVMRESTRRILRLAALAGVFLPPYYQVAVWRPAFGQLPANLEELRLPVCVVLFGVSYSPLVLFFVSRGMRRIHRQTLENARLLTASHWRILWRVILPLSAPAITAGAALVFVMVILNYEVPALLFLPVYPVEIFLEYQAGRDVGAAFLFSLPLVALAVAALALLNRFLDGSFRWRWSETMMNRMINRTSVWSFGPWGKLGAVLFVAVMVVWPLAKLLSMAGGTAAPRAVLRVFELYGGEIVDGVWVSVLATFVAVFLAALAVPRHGRSSRLVAMLVWVPMAIPGSLLGAALIRIYNQPFLDNRFIDVYSSPLILVVAAVARFFPVAFHALSAHLRTVPEELWESADLLSRGRSAKFFRAYLPLAAPGLALAATAFLLFAAMELAASVLVAPPGAHPVALTVYNLLHYNTVLEDPVALCLVQFVLVVGLAGFLWFLVSRVGAERRF